MAGFIGRLGAPVCVASKLPAFDECALISGQDARARPEPKAEGRLQGGRRVGGDSADFSPRARTRK